MAASAGASAGVFHVRNTLRFSMARDAPGELAERLPFNREVLLGVLKLQFWEIYCVQCNGLQRCFDVTLYTKESYRRALEGVQANKEHPTLKPFVTQPLWKENFWVLSLRLYNPFVPTERIESFLERYCNVEPISWMVPDDLGIWTGLRQYRVYLRPDPEGWEGYRHHQPPSA